MVTPIFQISRRQQGCDEAKKAAIMNLLAKRVHHDRVVERIEASLDVSLHKVGGSDSLVIDLRERGVASSIRVKPVGEVGECTLSSRQATDQPIQVSPWQADLAGPRCSAFTRLLPRSRASFPASFRV